MAVPERKHWRPKKLMPAALNSLINMDEPLHREMRMQQNDFFFQPIAAIRDRVGARIDELLDEMERKGPVVDFVDVLRRITAVYPMRNARCRRRRPAQG